MGAELYDGRSFSDILQDLLATASGKITESPPGTFTVYERDNVTSRYVLQIVASDRVRV